MFQHIVENIIRCEQGSNLRGKIPLDFKSNALTTRPSQHANQTSTIPEAVWTHMLQNRTLINERNHLYWPKAFWNWLFCCYNHSPEHIHLYMLRFIDASGINVLAHSRLSLCTETLEVVGTQNHLAQSAGFEPARAEPNRFLVCRLNHSAMTAYMKGWTQKSPCANKGHPWVFNIGSGDHHIENSLSEVGFEPTPGEPDCDLNAAP